MKKMNIDKVKKTEDSSDYEDVSEAPSEMEVDAVPVTKTIAKKKPLPRSYYQALKKTLRRHTKCGTLPNIAQIDNLLAEMKD
jgi:hypothetical protein